MAGYKGVSFRGGVITAPIYFPDGTEEDPSIAFSSDNHSGLYLVEEGTVGMTGTWIFSPDLTSSGDPAGFGLFFPANTGITAGQAQDMFTVDPGTQTWAAGEMNEGQAFSRFKQPTAAGTGAGSTFAVYAATVNIDAGPTQGSNATLGASIGLFIGNEASTSVAVKTGGEIYGAVVMNMGIASGVANVARNVGLLAGDILGGVSLGNASATLTQFASITSLAANVSSTTNTRTITRFANVDIAGMPSAGDNIAVTAGAQYALVISQKDGAQNIANVAGSSPAFFYMDDQTVVLKNATNVTATPGIAGINLGTITVNQSGGAVTMTNAATLYIEGAPLAGTSVTLTNSYPIWVDSGVCRFDNGVLFGTSSQSTLSDYRESTITPNITLVGGAGNTVPVYSSNTGIYTRVGRTVLVDYYFEGDGGAEGAGTGVYTVELPINAHASQPTGLFPCGYAINNVTEYQLYGQIAGSGSTISLKYFNLISTTADFTGADQNNASRSVRLKFSYQV